MLVNNNFDTYFQKTCIENCGVKIYQNNSTPTLLLDNTNISSFSMSRVNHGIVEDMPNDNTIIEVINWNSLSSSIKNYFIEGNFVKITFIVENSETSNCVIQRIKKVEKDYDEFKAKIICESPIAGMTEYTNAGMLINGDLKTFPFKATSAETSQHLGIGYGNGRRINPINKTAVANPSISVFTLSDISTAIMFNKKNIHQGISKYVDENDRSSIISFGVTTKDETTITEKETYYYSTYIDLDDQYVVTGISCEVEINGSWTSAGAIIDTIYSNTVTVHCTWTSYSHYRFKLLGYKANVEVPTETKKYIKSYIWLDTQTAKLATVQTNARAYYSHLMYYEFDCRIDPRIEPQDNIAIDGIGLLRVEEVKINFNGGLRGHIKGRLFHSVDDPLDSPVLTTLDLSTWEIRIDNPNPYPVILRVYYSAGYLEFNMSANGYLWLDNDNASAINESVIAYNQQLLMDAVSCRFLANDYGGASNSTIILESNY